MELSSNLDVVSAIVQICLIDLLLSGDNAILIAMACAGLPADIRPRAALLGTGAAVLFRVILTFVATLALRAPYLKLFGAGLLLLIAIELLAADSAGQQSRARQEPDAGLWRAIVLIVVADAVMSLDNVVAVAAAAQDNFLYLVVGLVISVPILVFASLFISRLLGAHPMLVEAGAALLGWIAGKTAVADPAVAAVLDTQSFGLVATAPLLAALYVWVQGRRLRDQRRGRTPREVLTGPPAAPGAMAQDAPVGAAAPLPRPGLASLPVAPGARVHAAPLATPAAPASAPTGTPAGAAPADLPVGSAAKAAGLGAIDRALDVPRHFSAMDRMIMAGVAVPLLGFVAMIIYFVVHAARAH